MTSSVIASLASVTPEEVERLTADLTEAQIEALLHDWREWARPQQLPPPGDWQTWLVLAGRGFGKTRTGAEWVRDKVRAGARRLALIAPTASDARDVMVEGESGLLAVSWRGDRTYDGKPLGRPDYEPSKRRLTWANGATATLFSAEEPERLRGPQHEAMWCDELAAWKYLRETWDMAMFGLRLGDAPQVCITTTPKPLPVLKEIMADAGTVVTRGSTFENRANLAGAFLSKIVRKYEGTRLGRQELDAEMLDDVPGALWTRDCIDETRVRQAVEMQRVVVAVDPSGTSGEGENQGDDVGILVAGMGLDERGYVLADRTCNLSPAGWAARAVAAYHEFQADRIVAERNFGGAMVEAVIRAADKNVPVRLVTASRGKIARAEPIAALYEQKRVSHIGAFPALEDELVQMTSGGYVGGGSPNRADALVWALTDLMLRRGTSWYVGS